MVKGVSKRVIEIRNPEDRCFERVVFFLSPGVDQESALVRMRSEGYLRSTGPRGRRGKWRHRGWKLLFQLTVAAALGGGLSALLTSLH